MLESYLLSVIKGEKRKPWDLLILFCLTLLEPVYRIGIRLRMLLYQQGILAKRQLTVPVISIGNLAVGGTGKTPLAIDLARRLAALGRFPSVILRGYRGKIEGARLVTKGLSTQETGDEAQLLARNLPGFPIAIGVDRYLAGHLAVGNGANVVILDDGLQYFGLHRDLEIILLRAGQPWENGHLIPRGLLREGKSGLRRADLIILTNIESASEEDIEESICEIRHWAPRTPIIRTAIRSIFLQSLTDWHQGSPTKESAEDFLKDRVIGAFTAIGKPDKFFNTLSDAGARIVEKKIKPDHDDWHIEDLSDLHSEILMTTEKDAIKMAEFLNSPMAKRIYVLAVQPLFDEADDLQLEKILRELVQ